MDGGEKGNKRERKGSDGVETPSNKDGLTIEKGAEGKGAEGKGAEGKWAEGKWAEGKWAEGKWAEGKWAEGKRG